MDKILTVEEIDKIKQNLATFGRVAVLDHDIVGRCIATIEALHNQLHKVIDNNTALAAITEHKLKEKEKEWTQKLLELQYKAKAQDEQIEQLREKMNLIV